MRLRLTDVATVLGTALALAGMGLVLLLVLLAHYQARHIRSALTMDVHLQDDCPADTLRAMQQYIQSQEWTRRLQYISKEQAREEYIRLTGDDFTEILEENPLPASLRIHLQPAWVDNAQMARVEQVLTRRFGAYILEVVRKRELVQAINRNIYRLSLALGAFAAVQLLIMLVLMSNAIRLAVYAQRLTIKTMQLVGALPGFIRRPFVVRAALLGLVSGLLAAAAVTALGLRLGALFPDVWQGGPAWLLYSVPAGVAALGVLLSACAAWLIVNRLLRTDVGALY